MRICTHMRGRTRAHPRVQGTPLYTPWSWRAARHTRGPFCRKDPNARKGKKQSSKAAALKEKAAKRKTPEQEDIYDVCCQGC